MSQINETKNILFPGVKDGETFRVGDVEFIKFPDVDGKTPVVAKDIVFRARFGDSNNFAESNVLKRLEKEVLPKILETVGEENVCTFQTDLTTLDGLKNYGTMKSKISLPTFDFYRANPEIFDQHKLNTWWWLATADSAQPRYDPVWVVCVAPSGNIYINFSNFFHGSGVRPFLLFESSIFGSPEE